LKERISFSTLIILLQGKPLSSM